MLFYSGRKWFSSIFRRPHNRSVTKLVNEKLQIMKRLFSILALTTTIFAACTTNSIEDIPTHTSQILKASFEEDSRIQLSNGVSVWTEGDLVSVFYHSNANQKWIYNGQTGERVAELTNITEPEATKSISKVVAIYPYNESYTLSDDCKINTTITAEQNYLAESFGIGSSLMVAESESNQIKLLNVMGWLRLHLTGYGEIIKSISFKGNNNELIAGSAVINPIDATLIFDNNSAAKDVTLNCTDGVQLGYKATTFYIALPPQTFTEGFTVEIKFADNSILTKSTSKSLTICRNTILPMDEFCCSTNIPDNQIWYTSSDDKVVSPYANYVFGVANIVSNKYENGRGVITFNKDVNKIGGSAFYKCKTITSISIPNSVTEIGASAFSQCTSLSSIIIPDNVVQIGNNAFLECENLKNINLGNGLTTIGGSAFRNCYSLTSIVIPNSVNSIGTSAFDACRSLESIIIPQGVAIIKDEMFKSCSNLASVTIPDSVISIGDYAFRDCSSLTSITIPNGVTSIGNYSFCGCCNFTSITIPNNVISIGDYAFYNCIDLKNTYCKPTVPPTLGNAVFKYSSNGVVKNIGCKINIPSSDDDNIINAYKTADGWSEYASNIEEYNFTE